MITIGAHNTDEWGTVTDYEIGTPEVQKRTYAIPGRDGLLDATETLTGYVNYNNRPIKIVVTVSEDALADYQDIYDAIYDYCHGKICPVTFPFDPDYYYEGRLAVEASQEDQRHGIVTITGDMFPYALKSAQTTRTINVRSSASVTLANSRMPTKISVQTSAAITIIWGTNSISLSAGTHTVHTPLLLEGGATFTIQGTATVVISYREGKL